MGEFHLKVWSLEKTLERHPELSVEEREKIEKKIRFFQKLDECSRYELLELFDTATFNSILEGYLKLAMDDMGMRKDTKKKLISSLRSVLDWYDAEQAERYGTGN